MFGDFFVRFTLSISSSSPLLSKNTSCTISIFKCVEDYLMVQDMCMVISMSIYVLHELENNMYSAVVGGGVLYMSIKPC